MEIRHLNPKQRQDGESFEAFKSRRAAFVKKTHRGRFGYPVGTWARFNDMVKNAKPKLNS